MSNGRWVVAAFLSVFWALVLLGGALEPGYSHVEDHVSRLASFGATWPAVGITAIVALAGAHAAAAVVLHRLPSRAGAAALGGAAVAGIAVAAFRVHCPRGAAGCRGAAASADTWTDAVHGYAVAGYEVALLMAMLAVAWWGSQRGRPAVSAVSLLAAGASLVTVLRVDEPAAGADQRLWLAVSTVWLLAVLRFAGAAPRAGRVGSCSAGTT